MTIIRGIHRSRERVWGLDEYNLTKFTPKSIEKLHVDRHSQDNNFNYNLGAVMSYNVSGT